MRWVMSADAATMFTLWATCDAARPRYASESERDELVTKTLSERRVLRWCRDVAVMLMTWWCVKRCAPMMIIYATPLRWWHWCDDERDDMTLSYAMMMSYVTRTLRYALLIYVIITLWHCLLLLLRVVYVYYYDITPCAHLRATHMPTINTIPFIRCAHYAAPSQTAPRAQHYAERRDADDIYCHCLRHAASREPYFIAHYVICVRLCRAPHACAGARLFTPTDERTPLDAIRYAYAERDEREFTMFSLRLLSDDERAERDTTESERWWATCACSCYILLRHVIICSFTPFHYLSFALYVMPITLYAIITSYYATPPLIIIYHEAERAP